MSAVSAFGSDLKFSQQKSGPSKDAVDKLVKGIKRQTRKQYLTKGKIMIVLASLRGEEQETLQLAMELLERAGIGVLSPRSI